MFTHVDYALHLLVHLLLHVKDLCPSLAIGLRFLLFRLLLRLLRRALCDIFAFDDLVLQYILGDITEMSAFVRELPDLKLQLLGLQFLFLCCRPWPQGHISERVGRHRIGCADLQHMLDAKVGSKGRRGLDGCY